MYHVTVRLNSKQTLVYTFEANERDIENYKAASKKFAEIVLEESEHVGSLIYSDSTRVITLIRVISVSKKEVLRMFKAQSYNVDVINLRQKASK